MISVLTSIGSRLWSICFDPVPNSPTMGPRLPTKLKYFPDHLYKYETKSRFGDSSVENFWGDELIKELLQPHLIRALLSKDGKPCDEKLVQFILKEAPKLFTITATLDSDQDQLLQAMNIFHTKGFNDSDLSPELGRGGKLMMDRELLEQTLSSFDEEVWRTSMVVKFCDVRWKVLIPTFSTSKDYELRTDTILPFWEIRGIDKPASERGRVKSGAFSIIRQVEICKGYYHDDRLPVS